MSLVDSWGAIHNIMISRLVGEHGAEKATSMFADEFREYGRRFGKQHSAESKDAKGIAEVIMNLEQDFGIKGEVLHSEPERVIRQITYCPWSSYFIPESCKVFVPWVEGIVEGINPDYAYKLTKMVPQGDENCQWIVYRRA